MSALAGFVAAAAALSGLLAAALERTPRLADVLDPDPVGARDRSAAQRQAAWLEPVLAGVVGWWLAGPLVALLGAGAVILVPRVRARRRHRRDERLVAEQLPDALITIAAALRAGMSLSRAVAFAAEGSDPPLRPRLRAVIEQEAMGVPLASSLRTWCGSLPGDGGRLLDTVLDLHQRAGGGFADVLDRVARTLQARATTERELRSLTAQGRLSGTILGVLPFAFLGFLFLTAPHDMAAAFASPAGLAALIVGLVMQALAFLWIRTLLRVAP